MDSLIESDLYRYGGRKGGCSLVKGLMIPAVRFMFLKRKCEVSKNYFVRLFYRILHRHYYIKYGIQIPWKTNIGPGFYIGHFGGIVINEATVIGNNCNVAHNVTIGQTNRGKNKGTVIIGNKVWIGTGSVLVGKINIGDNVLIAPNSYINYDIPSNSIVINNEIIDRVDATDGYINWCVDKIQIL